MELFFLCQKFGGFIPIAYLCEKEALFLLFLLGYVDTITYLCNKKKINRE